GSRGSGRAASSCSRTRTATRAAASGPWRTSAPPSPPPGSAARPCTSVAPAEWASLADSVTVCFSKGLGCPLGAVLAGSAALVEEAWEGKFLFGGALRQSGVVAAAMLYALEHNVERLADDHARARRLAEGLYEAGVPVDLDAVETNFVGIELAPLALSEEEAVAR